MGRRNEWAKTGAALGIATIAMQVCALCQSSNTSPSYSAQSIVNSATQTAEALAPNTIATIYGSNLAFNTVAAGASNMNGATLPTSMGGVSVLVGGLTANLFYVSPTQINFLIPYEFTPGTVGIAVIRQGLAGPVVNVQLNAASPGLFPYSGGFAIAEHLNGALISPSSPAAAGEIVVLFAVGLGRVLPDTTSGRVASGAASIRANPFQVLLNGAALPASNILYAGLAPGFAGLYQINLKLPDNLPSNPQIVVSADSLASPSSVMLATQPPPAN